MSIFAYIAVIVGFAAIMVALTLVEMNILGTKFASQVREEIIDRQAIKNAAKGRLDSLNDHWKFGHHGNPDEVVSERMEKEKHIIQMMDTQIKTLRFIGLYGYDHSIREHGRNIFEFDRRENEAMLSAHESLFNLYDECRIAESNRIYKRIEVLEKRLRWLDKKLGNK